MPLRDQQFSQQRSVLPVRSCNNNVHSKFRFSMDKRPTAGGCEDSARVGDDGLFGLARGLPYFEIVIPRFCHMILNMTFPHCIGHKPAR
jgi:hypothetical protein